MVYTVTLNPAIDYVVSVENLKQGEVNRTKSENFFYGGKGINVSRVLKEFRVESTALGFVAGFTGKQLEGELNKSGVKTDFTELPNGITRINIKLKAEKETDINADGPQINEEALSMLLGKLSYLNSNDFLCLSGSAPKSAPENVFEQLICSLKDSNVKVVVDTTGQRLLDTLKYKPFLIKPNIDELAEIFSEKLFSDDDIIRCANELRQRGAQNVLISMAGDGAILVCENGEIFKEKSPKGIVRNSVGAGDSMVAGFIAGYIETKNYKHALRCGIAAGSATAFSDDLCTIDDIRKLLK